MGVSKVRIVSDKEYEKNKNEFILSLMRKEITYKLDDNKIIIPLANFRLKKIK